LPRPTWKELLSLTARIGAPSTGCFTIYQCSLFPIRRTIDMHFRVYDLSAERCVWSIPPIDTVPVRLRGEKLLVRSVDNEGGVFEVASVDGEKLADIATQQLADRRAARLSIHLATDDSYAGHVVRFYRQ
jgi:hypothetical protein